MFRYRHKLTVVIRAHNPDAVPQGHTKLPDYVPVGQFPRTLLRDLFTAASGDALNLLSRCLTYEPRRRISAREVRLFLFENYMLHESLFSCRTCDLLAQALYHPYFTSLPYPTHPSKLPKPASVQSRPLEEVDGNVELSGLDAKAAPPNKLKRKLSSPMDGLRPLARKLDFGAL